MRLIDKLRAWRDEDSLVQSSTPEEPHHRLTTEEALGLFQAENEAEWEDDA